MVIKITNKHLLGSIFMWITHIDVHNFGHKRYFEGSSPPLYFKICHLIVEWDCESWLSSVIIENLVSWYWNPFQLWHLCHCSLVYSTHRPETFMADTVPFFFTLVWLWFTNKPVLCVCQLLFRMHPSPVPHQGLAQKMFQRLLMSGLETQSPK